MPSIYKDGKWYVGESSGHLIKNNGADLYPREALNFTGFDVQDDSVNDETDIKAHRLTQAELDEIIGLPMIEIPKFTVENAGYHNSIYRGKYLGTEYTAAQKAAISSGLFTDLFIGDFWVIAGVTYRIAAFDYWYNTGDTACTTHHAVIVPDSMYTAKMNNTNITTGAYIGSVMYTTNLGTAKTKIKAAFGADNILTHREYFCNATAKNANSWNNEYESAGAWYDSQIDLMNEQMCVGHRMFANYFRGGNWAPQHTVSNGQLPLFRFRNDLIGNRVTFWLRSVYSTGGFCAVNGLGYLSGGTASTALGTRPAFAIK